MDPSFLVRFLNKAVAKGILPGATYIIGRGTEVIRGSVGANDLDHPSRKISPNSICRLMSMTKTLVAAGVMACIDDGLLTMNDAVGSHLPEFKRPKVLVEETDSLPGYERANADGFTVPPGFTLVYAKHPLLVKHLLQHTNGMTMYTRDLSPLLTPSEFACIKITKALGIVSAISELQRGISLEDHIKLAAKAPLAFEPGTQYNYGKGLDVAGRLIEVVTGKPLEQFLQERIFTPCHMVDTAFSVPAEKLARFPSLHASIDAFAKGLIQLPDEDIGAGKHSLPVTNAYIQNEKPPAWPCSSSGAVGTAEDYFNFTQMLLCDGEFEGKQVLSRSSARLMMSSSDTILRGFPLHGFHGFRAACGGAVTPGSGVSGIIPEGVFTWSGLYMTLFFVDRDRDASGVIMSQALVDTDKMDLCYQQFLNGATRAYLDVDCTFSKL